MKARKEVHKTYVKKGNSGNAVGGSVALSSSSFVTLSAMFTQIYNGIQIP